jgi:hypothetical protein
MTASKPLRTGGGGVNFVDNDAVLWTVTECDALDVPGKRGDRCLIFASSDAVRRVWEYPADWRELLTPSFIALSWSR